MPEITFTQGDGGGSGGGSGDVDEMLDRFTAVLDRIENDPRLRALAEEQFGVDTSEITQTDEMDISEQQQQAVQELDAETVGEILQNVEAFMGSETTIREVREQVEENPERIDVLLDHL